MKKGNTIKFKIISILLPFIFLTIIELILRLFNFGYDTSVILIDHEYSDFCYLNQDLSKKYFTSEQLATSGNKDFFKRNKDTNTFRIFVLGGSSALGFPYNHNGSISRMIKYRLERNYPEMNFDVINCAMVGVNSYTVLDISKGIVDYQPDAIVIYMGHNEYYGALGVASTNKLGRNRNIVKTTIYLRKLRIFQALMKFREYIIKKLNPEPGEFKNRMERMADKNVPYKSEIYEAGIRQFDENLKEILQLFKQHNIPVFIGNIISNEKDQMPFESQLLEPHTNDKWYNLYTTSLDNFKKEEKDGAYQNLLAVNEIDSTYAMAQFLKGQLAYEQKKYAEAKRCMTNAKELDLVRFRAPEEINRSIQNGADKYKNYFVNIKEFFESRSPNGIIGKELVLEHLHPNIEGYHLIAECFVEAINKSQLIKSKYTEQSSTTLRFQYPLSIVDSIRGQYEIYMLKESWPFYEKIPDSVTSKGSYIEQIAGGLSVKQFTWNQAMAMLEEYYVKNNDKKGQLLVNEAFTLEYNFDPQFFIKAARLSDDIGNYERAAFYSKEAFYLSPTFENAKRAFLAYLKVDEPDNSIKFIDFAISNNTSNFDMPAFKKSVLRIIDLIKTLDKEPDNLNILKEIALTYELIGNQVGTQKYTELIKSKDPYFLVSSEHK
ncbi:MAG: hypothetical protein P1P88_04535 [Bacteroidales bacterium]|nr:hypothetical protein [Bacteroidales bacterium]